LEVRNDIKYQILNFINQPMVVNVGTQMITHTKAPNIIPITWKEYYNFSWWTKLWMIGL
jgi:hypothetical protein